jgi:Ca2+-transporting ATPase
MNEKWFFMPIGEVEKKLKTNAASGLNLKAAKARLAKDEPFFRVRKRNIGLLIVDLFADFFLLLLTLVSFFALFFEGDRVIGTATLILIFIELAVVFLIHFRDKRNAESLSKLFLPTARVIRGGKLYILDYKDVVVGDVIMIEKGDVIGVDARLVHSDNLKVRMRLDKKNEKDLEKLAGGAVNENELYA